MEWLAYVKSAARSRTLFLNDVFLPANYHIRDYGKRHNRVLLHAGDVRDLPFSCELQ